jgi:hypothetical protein
MNDPIVYLAALKILTSRCAKGDREEQLASNLRHKEAYDGQTPNSTSKISSCWVESNLPFPIDQRSWLAEGEELRDGKSSKCCTTDLPTDYCTGKSLHGNEHQILPGHMNALYTFQTLQSRNENLQKGPASKV